MLPLETRCAVTPLTHYGQVPHARESPTATETLIVLWGPGINPVDVVILANLTAVAVIVIVVRFVIAGFAGFVRPTGLYRRG